MLGWRNTAVLKNIQYDPLMGSVLLMDHPTYTMKATKNQYSSLASVENLQKLLPKTIF